METAFQKKMEEMIVQLGIADKVTLHGTVPGAGKNLWRALFSFSFMVRRIQRLAGGGDDWWEYHHCFRYTHEQGSRG